jgi:pimeloyl-ACP methyl ester carboxylesterase
VIALGILVMTSHQLFSSGESVIEALVDGKGPLVVLIASLGRSARDFDDLVRHLVAAGYMTARPQPRGIGQSRGKMTGVSLRDLAGDVAAVIEGLGGGSAVLIGHAFGQRVARMLSATRPDLCRAVVMLAARGKVPVSERARDALQACFDETLPTDQHIAHVRCAFFAAGNHPTVWSDGWHRNVAEMQCAATTGLGRNETTTSFATIMDAWWAGGNAKMLVVQGLQDTVAVPENGRLLKAEAGSRIELIEIDGAGHALLPERPDEVATHVLDFLKRLPSRSM